jgi:uncharacterized membrane protein
LRWKTAVFATIVVLSNAVGNLSLSWGLKNDPGELGLSPVDYIVAIFNPWVIGGILLLILWLLSRMALLSWADLSYVLPVTAMGYVASLLLARVFLHEHVTPQRWMGTALIVLGIALVARTTPKTTDGGLR